MAELYLRISNIGYGHSPHVSSPVFHHVHPKNYTYNFYLPGDRLDSSHTVFFNEEGLRSDPNREPKQKSGKRIVFFGDSFTEALQVPYKNSFCGIIDYKTNAVVKNYGISSYCPIFYLLLWRKIVKDFRPTHVIVQLYDGDINDDDMYNRIAIKDMNDEVIAIPGPKHKPLIKIIRKSYLARFLRKIQMQIVWLYNNRNKEKHVVGGYIEETVAVDFSKLSFDIIVNLKNEVEMTGAKFLLMAIPSKFNIINRNNPLIKKRDNSNQWKLFCQKQGIKFLDLVDIFNKEMSLNDSIPFFDNDIHLNKYGNKIIGKHLISYVNG